MHWATADGFDKGRSYFDMWREGIGAQLPVVDAKKNPTPLQILGHTIECDKTQCFDTFSAKGTTPLLFSDPKFEDTFRKRLTFEHYSKILRALKSMNCELRIVGAAN